MTNPVLLSWLLSLVSVIVGLLLAYIVVRFAVLHALRAHSIWATPENVNAGRLRLEAKAAAEAAARRDTWAYQQQERTPTGWPGAAEAARSTGNVGDGDGKPEQA